MKAILYICHGSRTKKGYDEAKRFIESFTPFVNVPIQQSCFLELCEPSILTGIQNCIVKGATTIIAVPILLLAAAHAKQDIPEQLAKAKEQFPDLTIIYGEPFGVQPKIIDALSEQVHAQSDAILLVGRGSSDLEAQQNFQTVGHLLEQKMEIPVQTCYLAAAQPTFLEALQNMTLSSSKHITIIPYLLFFGQLIAKMERTIDSFRNDHQVFVLGEPIGRHPVLYELLKKQINDLMQKG
ncbi:sirohydrochlorin chelatase [Thermolongibacillus altinsuensis]|uniref:sirohydrochlorin chelatase n=1 Tax=Thermolongibacillus altinsuensis TaxID=575256 RepID=UPI00242A3217|nr:sirohydrochlorin chelatase [Thermolongibacillus altinsuensis]GMB09260.1 cobalamin biosynthesis protein CbiX [Thermolongibacillus altinsuensis]